MAGYEIATQSRVEGFTVSTLQPQPSNAQSEVLNYELGKFPKKGKEADWTQAKEITKDTDDLRKNLRYNEAIEKATQAIKIYPYDANIYLDRALSYYEQGVKAETAGNLAERNVNLRSAVQDFNKALESNSDWRLYAGLGRTFIHLGQLPEALDATEKSLYKSSPLPPQSQRDTLVRLIEALNKRIHK